MEIAEDARAEEENLAHQKKHPKSRACLKIGWGPSAKDFDLGQGLPRRTRGGETGASPRRAMTGEPMQVKGKRAAARRVFVERAAPGHLDVRLLATEPALRSYRCDHGIAPMRLQDLVP